MQFGHSLESYGILPSCGAVCFVIQFGSNVLETMQCDHSLETY